MTSLRAIMKDKLEKVKILKEQTPPSKTRGRLREFFDSEQDDSVTDEEIQSVIDDRMPYLDEEDPNYEKDVRDLARIKRDNPALYAKMKAWD